MFLYVCFQKENEMTIIKQLKLTKAKRKRKGRGENEKKISKEDGK